MSSGLSTDSGWPLNTSGGRTSNGRHRLAKPASGCRALLLRRSPGARNHASAWTDKGRKRDPKRFTVSGLLPARMRIS